MQKKITGNPETDNHKNLTGADFKSKRNTKKTFN